MKGAIVVRERKDGKRYFAVWRAGGRQKWKAFRRQKDADRFLTNVVKQTQDGTYRDIRPITFKEYAEQWIAGLGNLKPSTARAYRSTVEHGLIPAWGERPITSLTVEDVNAYLAKKAATLKPKTLRNQLTLLHKLLGDAVESGYLAVNRLHGSRAVRRPRALREEDETEIEVLTPAEVNALLDVLGAPYQLLFQTAASTGLRLGELLGLQWGDVDHGRRQLRMRRTLYRGAYYTPKTRRSKRDVDVGPQLLGALRVLAEAEHGGAPAPDTPIFTTAAGALIDPDNLRQRVWAPALRAAELRHVRIHSLRHFYASALIAQGESVKYVSSQLGHASAQITIDRYGHLFPNEKRTSADRLEAMLAASNLSNNRLTEPAGTPENNTEHGAGERPEIAAATRG